MSTSGAAALPVASARPEPSESASAAGLIYVTDESPGITRRRAGRAFAYLDAKGQLVRDLETLGRIRSLVIPPAWTGIWICPSPRGHIQATGRDARGRKQYRYHARWRLVRDETKYGRMVAFARALPQIRARLEADLARPGHSREKILALVVRLLEVTLIRVGNEEYTRQNRSFGLTTLRNHHVEVRRGRAAGSLIETPQQKVGREVKQLEGLPREEAMVVALLTRRLAAESRAAGAQPRAAMRAARPARPKVRRPRVRPRLAA